MASCSPNGVNVQALAGAVAAGIQQALQQQEQQQQPQQLASSAGPQIPRYALTNSCNHQSNMYHGCNKVSSI